MSVKVLHPYLYSLKRRLSNLLVSSKIAQLWIIGPEGRGKSTFVRSLCSDLKINVGRGLFNAYFDFQSCSNNNCQVMISKFVDSLISSAACLTPESSDLIRSIYYDLLDKIPEMRIHIHDCFKFIVNNSTNTGLINSLNRILELREKNQVTFTDWWESWLLIMRYSPHSLGIIKKNVSNPIEQCLFFLNTIGVVAERTEIEKYDQQNVSMNLTGKWITRYIFEAFASIEKHYKISWILCFDDLEHLIRSPHLQDRGILFLSHLITCLQNSEIPAIFISNDSAAVLSIFSGYYSNVFNKDLYHDCLPSSMIDLFDPENFLFYDIPELPRDLIINILMEHLQSPSEEIVKIILENIGGNYKLLQKAIRYYKDFQIRMNLNAVQQMLSGSTNIVDDEFFPISQNKEDQISYLKEEQCKLFVKGLYDECLNEEIIKFEHTINTFLSAPSIEYMRANSNNKIHFLVMVFETIRHLLHKEWLQLKEDCEINNAVILALVTCNILFYRMESRAIEFKNSLTKQLLRYYIDSEYESLTGIEQLEYKVNFLLNQKKIYHEANRLFV